MCRITSSDVNEPVIVIISSSQSMYKPFPWISLSYITGQKPSENYRRPKRIWLQLRTSDRERMCIVYRIFKPLTRKYLCSPPVCDDG